MADWFSHSNCGEDDLVTAQFFKTSPSGPNQTAIETQALLRWLWALDGHSMIICTSNKNEYWAITWSHHHFTHNWTSSGCPMFICTLNKYENQATTRCSLPFPKHVNTEQVPNTHNHLSCKRRSGGIWYSLSFEAHVNINWSLNNHFHLSWRLELGGHFILIFAWDACVYQVVA